MFFPLMVKLGLEKSEVIPQLVVLRPVLLGFLERKCVHGVITLLISEKGMRAIRQTTWKSAQTLKDCQKPLDADILTVAIDFSHSC